MSFMEFSRFFLPENSHFQVNWSLDTKICSVDYPTEEDSPSEIRRGFTLEQYRPQHLLLRETNFTKLPTGPFDRKLLVARSGA